VSQVSPFKKFLLGCLFVFVFSVTPAAASTITGTSIIELQPPASIIEMQPAASITEMLPASKYDIYLKLDGIDGDSVAKSYEKWIQLSGVQFNAANVTSGGSGGGGGVAGKAALNNFIITKQVDSSSIPLFVDVVSGKHIKNGKLVFQTRTKPPILFLSIDLDNILVSDYKFNNANETYSFKFNSIRMSYYPIDFAGRKLPPISGGWDFNNNVGLN
jgi:type VI secretion system secreted protein Hcp